MLLDPQRYPWVCGVVWWQGYNDDAIQTELRKGRKKNQRMPWIKRIYGRDNICSSKVFALEICPYHSRQWRFAANDGCILNFVKSNVFEPAIKAVQENGLPFAVGVGREISIMLDNLNNDGVRLEQKWSCVIRDGERVLSNNDLNDCWPRKQNGEFVIRSYRLYAMGTGRILVTWAPGGNTAPKSSFNGIEEKIRNYSNDNPLQ